MSLTVGQQVRFGRSSGEQTLGTVMKINGKSVSVRQDESRGSMRSYPVGTIWKVSPTLVTPVTGGASAPVSAPVVPVSARSGFSIGSRVEFTHPTKGVISGTVTRVNPKSVTLSNTSDGHAVGWRVAPGSLRSSTSPAPVAAPVAAMPAGVRVGSTVSFTAFSFSARGPALSKGVVTKVGSGSVEVYGNGRTHKRVVGEFTVCGRRTDAEIVSECLSVYCGLSPENLTHDGERRRSEVAAAAAELNRALRALFIEAGRQISESEAYRASEKAERAMGV